MTIDETGVGGDERRSERPGIHPEDFTDVEYEVREGVASVTIGRPGVKGGGFSHRTYGETTKAVQLATVDPDVDVIVLRGNGRNFATGGDLGSVIDGIEQDGLTSIYRFTEQPPFGVLLASPKAIIAAVDGYCWGGGLLIALACDVVVATERSTFCFPEGLRGLAERWSPALMMHRVPVHVARYLTMTSRVFSAQEAERWSFVNEVVDDGSLEGRVEGLVAEFRRTSPASRRLFKGWINEFIDTPKDAGVLEAFQTPECIEAMRAFRDRRLPAWAPDRDQL